MSNEFDIFVVGTMCGMTIGLIIETTIFNLGRPWKAGTGPEFLSIGCCLLVLGMWLLVERILR
jgi:hypothetical protein